MRVCMLKGGEGVGEKGREVRNLGDLFRLGGVKG